MSAIPVYRDSYLSQAATRRRSHRFADAAYLIACRILLFALVAAVAYVASALTGNVMMEKARRDGILAQERAREARAAEGALRESIDDMTSLDALNDWACAHGFSAPEQLARAHQGAEIVASNR
jgi:hypothetical protein